MKKCREAGCQGNHVLIGKETVMGFDIIEASQSVAVSPSSAWKQETKSEKGWKILFKAVHRGKVMCSSKSRILFQELHG